MGEKLSNEVFVDLANAKGCMVHALKENLVEGWAWLVVEEEPDRIVIEIRKINYPHLKAVDLVR